MCLYIGAELKSRLDELEAWYQSISNVCIGAELKSRLEELEAWYQSINNTASKRAEAINSALNSAEGFRHQFSELIQTLQGVQDTLVSQDSAGVDPNTVRDQQKELEVC